MFHIKSFSNYDIFYICIIRSVEDFIHTQEIPKGFIITIVSHLKSRLKFDLE